jgi:hypothetical protein
LLGGFFVDNLSWRWVFYVNVPIGIVALIVIAIVLPKSKRAGRPIIDYAGIALLAGAASCTESGLRLLREVAAALAQQSHVKVDGETVSITESGRRVAALLVTAREEILNEFVEGWDPQDHPDVAALVREISARLSGEERGLVGAGRTAARPSDTGPDVI